MGSGYTYICGKCGYEHMYYGVRGVGMRAVIGTRVCKDCNELVGVTLGFYGKDGPSGDPEQDKNLNRCPECRGTNLKRWANTRPCPKCKGKMRVDPDSRICWD